MKKKFKGLLLSIPVLMAFGMMYGYNEYHRTQEDTAGLGEKFRVSSSDLIQDFESNENTANAKYLGKVISVTGIVAKTELNGSTQTIFLKSHSRVAFVNCQFEKTYTDKIAGLQTGQTITVKGICTGMLMDVVLNRCALMKNN